MTNIKKDRLSSEKLRTIAVLNPEVQSIKAVELLPLAPRIDTLNGKTVYLIDVGFGGDAGGYSLLTEMQKWFGKNYPQMNTVLKRKPGSFGEDAPDLWKEIRTKGSAMIMAVGHWDGCSSAVARHCKTMEQMGIPTAPIVGYIFHNYLTTYDMVNNTGMPLRFTYLPMPIAGMPPEVHKAYIEGNDPITSLPVMQQVIEALTKPLTADEQRMGMPQEGAPQPRLLTPDTEENLRQLFIEKDWTDGLPVILPTEARVKAMLAGTQHKPDEVVVAIRERAVTVEKVATCAVMAGAKPEYLPVILAIAASGQITFGSTTSMAKMIVVNGPICQEIDMNSGMGALGPFNQANAVIGRALTIMCKGPGNSHVGGSYVGSLGSNLSYNNLCFAENEERLPQGWNSVGVQMGFKPTDSVVSLFIGWSYISSVGEIVNYPPHLWIRDYMRALSGLGSAATLIIDPMGAEHLRELENFSTKEMLHQWLSENVEIPARQYWGNGVNSTFNLSLAYQGLEPYSTWQKVDQDTLIKPFNNPKNINTIVVGGGTQTVWFLTDMRLVRGVSIDVWR